MRELNMNEIEKVFGQWLPALAALVAVFSLPHIINDHRQEYNKWGRELGGWIYDQTHSYDPNR